MARSPIGDAADILKAFPQMSYNEYMYERSIAQINLMIADSTHIKYLDKADKKMIENYNKMLKAQEAFDNFIGVDKEDK